MTEQQLRERIANMTLKEKLAEMLQYNYSELGLNASGDVTGNIVVENITTEELRRIGSVLNVPDAKEAQNFRKVRKEMGIDEPAVIMYDVIHGLRTIYPIPLAMACSFDLDLIEACAEMAGIESKYEGIDVVFSPMVDLVRDPRWGRVMESAGEDPYLGGEVGKAFIRGYHKADVACCVKHFAVYGAAEAGRDYNTTDVSEHTMKEYYLRGYQACMQENPELVMSSFNLLNGKPLPANKQLMCDTLRDEWGFDGVVISDWGSLSMMIPHGYTPDGKACAKASIDTKHDIEMCSTTIWANTEALIKEGKVKEADIDESVLRILKLKDKLGMYENPDRFTDPQKCDEVCLSKEHRTLARKAAEDSIILLKNKGILPLSEDTDAAFIGPFYDNADIIGNWRAKGSPDDAVSVRSGVEALLQRPTAHAKGCGSKLLDSDESGIPEAVEIAKKHDVIVACVGEPGLNSGERHSRTDIRIPALQRKLLVELAKLGKPIVLIVFGGRPHVLKEVEPLADAILYAWQPGTEGGNAIANLLYGKAVPNAKTVMTFPRAIGQIPIYYNHFRTGAPTPDENIILDGPSYGSRYDDEYNSPLYPFGYGLSYTTFAYSDFRLSSDRMSRGGKITATVRVKNTGDFDGKEIIQWYIHDKFASIVRPIQELKGFEKIFLRKGEEKTVSFTVDENVLAFHTESGEFQAESGDFTLFVGGNSRDCSALDFVLTDE